MNILREHIRNYVPFLKLFKRSSLLRVNFLQENSPTMDGDDELDLSPRTKIYFR